MQENLQMVDIGVQCSLEQILEVGFYHRCSTPLSFSGRDCKVEHSCLVAKQAAVAK